LYYTRSHIISAECE